MMDDMNTRMPALYIGHGAPPLLDDPLWSSPAGGPRRDLPRPKAILIVSAHWESAPVSLSATGPGVGLVYDFGGFAEKYYRMTYDTPDASPARPADRRADARHRAGAPAPAPRARPRRLGAAEDHVPRADIPVIQMSLPTHDPYRLMALGPGSRRCATRACS